MSRPSPTASAKLFPNQILTGNDGLQYLSKQVSNGSYRWFKLPNTSGTASRSSRRSSRSSRKARKTERSSRKARRSTRRVRTRIERKVRNSRRNSRRSSRRARSARKSRNARTARTSRTARTASPKLASPKKTFLQNNNTLPNLSDFINRINKNMRDFEKFPRKKIGFKKENLGVLLAFDIEKKKKNGNYPDIKGWWISEKLDGIRAYWSHKDGELLSRNGNIIIAPNWFIQELPKDVDLDGELWIEDKKSFDKINGMISKHVPVDEDWEKVKYMVFDVPDMNAPYEERVKLYTDIIKKMKSKHVVPVDTWKAKDLEHIFSELKRVEKMGGEGLMLRKPESLYERKRSSSLLKVKSFEDDEAIVTGYTKGTGKYADGYIGAIVAKDKKGKEIVLGSGLTDEVRKNPPPIGSKITYKFFEKTKTGANRHPIYVGIRYDL
jgi:DNA ligase-1